VVLVTKNQIPYAAAWLGRGREILPPLAEAWQRAGRKFSKKIIMSSHDISFF